jgi:hypothetical protein
MSLRLAAIAASVKFLQVLNQSGGRAGRYVP